ncbi:hypothetical protein FA13DRAFT_1736636 [Coprinellus micaceus]|uniref:A-kinase anchor protein 7-like phosphoesterase domain-containing protein n=1 Tax=Coprinellus micaceus TaxID=71717 RepID=A0A4Y7T026_COPMI|nr:hypothetical protein FA13DRAFT_1736636 [Coprinellus micaceus]
MSTPNSAPSSSRLSRQPASNPDANSGRGRGDRGGLRGRGGRVIANAVFEQSTAGADSPSTPRQQDSGGWKGRGGHRGQGGSHPQSWGRGGAKGGGRAGGRNEPPAPRPTHFLALPLHTHPRLASLVSSFQSALLAHDPSIAGLNGSIVIDPRRLHLTLGVMALEEEEGPAPTSASHTARSPGQRGPHPADSVFTDPSTRTTPTDPSHHPPIEPKRTITSALVLLRSLRPQISTILAGARVKFPLEKMDVFPPGATSNANVLFLGPNEPTAARRRNGNGRNNGERSEWDVLWSVADFVHQAFKSAGYITDTRPLKLHCTILNASHRKPRVPRYGFSFADVLKAEGVTGLLGVGATSVEFELVPDATRTGDKGAGGAR